VNRGVRSTIHCGSIPEMKRKACYCTKRVPAEYPVYVRRTTQCRHDTLSMLGQSAYNAVDGNR
jgi:hypothetical protein